MSDKQRPSEEIDAPLPIIATPGEGVPTPSIYTARDVARIVGVTPRCIYQYATKHKLGKRIGQKGLIFDYGSVRGRGVSCFGGLAPLTLYTYEARAA